MIAFFRMKAVQRDAIRILCRGRFAGGRYDKTVRFYLNIAPTYSVRGFDSPTRLQDLPIICSRSGGRRKRTSAKSIERLV